MNKKNKSEEYFIEAKLTVQTNKAVLLSSLDDALAFSKELTVQDFVEILGDHNDSTLEIIGVNKR